MGKKEGGCMWVHVGEKMRSRVSGSVVAVSAYVGHCVSVSIGVSISVRVRCALVCVYVRVYI